MYRQVKYLIPYISGGSQKNDTVTLNLKTNQTNFISLVEINTGHFQSEKLKVD